MKKDMQTFYKFKHKDPNIEKHSSSGGAFTMLSDEILGAGGIVYGCVLNEKLNAVHMRATCKSERDQMRGSKYIQSNMSATFAQLAEDLRQNKAVMFSGTPCQISAVYNYLHLKKIQTDSLVSVEVICHGVGSNRFFHDYVKNKEEKYHSKAVSANFRSKYRAGQKQDMTIEFENEKAYHAASTNLDWFYSIYLRNLILRPSCYTCKFAKMDREADISIADFWGGKNAECYSLIVCNSSKGASLLKNQTAGKLEEVDKETVHQPHMKAPCDMPKERNQFWNVYLNDGYDAVQTKFGNNTTKGKIKYCMADMLQSLHLAGTVKKLKNR